MQHGIARGRTIDSHARLGTTATRERHERPRPPRVGRRQPRLHITPGSKQQCRPQAIDHHWRRRQATTAHGEQWLHSGGGQPQPGGAQRHRPRCEQRQEQRRRHAQPLSRLRQQQQSPQWSSWRQLRRPQPPWQASGRQLRRSQPPRQASGRQLRQPRPRIL